MPYPRIKYSESYYKNVDSNSDDFSTGVIPIEGEKIGIHRFIASGADPSCYVVLVWDFGGASQKIFASTKGDIDITFDSSIHDMHITGDGVKKLQIMIKNDNDSASPIIGGRFEAIEVD